PSRSPVFPEDLRAEEIVAAIADEMLNSTTSGVAKSKFPKTMTFGFAIKHRKGDSTHDGDAAESKWIGSSRIRGDATRGDGAVAALTGGFSDAAIPAATGAGEMLDRVAGNLLQFLFRGADLVGDLILGEIGEVGVRHRVRTDFQAEFAEVPELGA